MNTEPRCSLGKFMDVYYLGERTKKIKEKQTPLVHTRKKKNHASTVLKAESSVIKTWSLWPPPVSDTQHSSTAPAALPQSYH